MQFGAECLGDGGVRFRLWAPRAQSVDVYLFSKGQFLAMQPAGDGWFELISEEALAGDTYQFRIDGNQKVPDPASRFQPEDVHGPSLVVDPGQFDWKDDDWTGRPWEETVLYELHVGTFSPEGTFAAVIPKLDYLVEMGITAIELMPLADFFGARNWGYDGVLPFAPDSSYGTPDDLKCLVQTAHRKGLMVFLDVVYNHFGPEGNYLRVYAPEFFTARHRTPWGDAINFDGQGSHVVREFFIQNALYWLEEYHFDGLRFDAVHAILDESRPDILTKLASVVRCKFRGPRRIHLVLENDNNAASYLRPDASPCPGTYDAQWNDDIHHVLHSMLTGETDGYYADYAQRQLHLLGRCLAEGFAYQGETSSYRDGARRGEDSRDLSPTAFVSFLQNHDQVGNRACGERIQQVASAAACKTAAAVLLLAPSPPLIFMGEEFGASTPFLFFCNFDGDLARAVTEGRRAEFAHFVRCSGGPIKEIEVPDPNALDTFQKSKLDWEEAKQPEHREWSRTYQELLTLRRQFIVPLLRGPARSAAEAKVFGDCCLRMDWKFGHATLGLVANFGAGPSRPEGLVFPGGQLIYSTSNADINRESDSPQMLPPWFVAWYLQP